MLEEKANRGSTYLAVFVLGYIACLGANHVQKLWSEHGQLIVEKTKVEPQLKAKLGCEKWRAGVAEGVAKQAIRGANSDSAPIPDAKEIPKDKCN